jgi:hypothetical protein
VSRRGALPTAVLSERLSEVIDGRRVRAAVFTTFSFDPGFFELHVLPLLFDETFSQVEKVRRIQLEDAVMSLDDLGVYYDSSALSQDALPAQLDFRRIAIRRTTGCFHPKLVLLLVDEHVDDDAAEDEEPYQSLIVGVQSANLTRGGWWESVECAHFEEISDADLDDSRCAFRSDLVSLLRRIEASSGLGEDHRALHTIREFVTERTNRSRVSNVSSRGRYFTRLFFGQQRSSFSDWLNQLRLGRHEWNLEVISPFLDAQDARPLESIIEVLAPRECRVHLPTDSDGAALVTEDCYEAVSDLARWSLLPGEIVGRDSSGRQDRLPPRSVHAKVYRLWTKGGSDLLIMGSVNLTSAAHSHVGAGNLEAAFLVDVTDEGYPRRWWLQPIDQDVDRFAHQPTAEDEGLGAVPLDLGLRYDWGKHALTYRLSEKTAGSIAVAETSGRHLFSISHPRIGNWKVCPDAAAESVREVLRSTSFLQITHDGGSWRVLVREDNMVHRPSLISQLTPEDILEYWALLTVTQRRLFIEDRLAADAELEGLSVARQDALKARDTLFDRFAGIYHSFGCLRRHIDEAIEDGRDRDAESKLLGAKYDSLPALLQKTLGREDGDPVVRYVTFLCARQLRESVVKEHRQFMRERKGRTAVLDGLLARASEVKESLSNDSAMMEFLDWYEPVFLAESGPELGLS